MEDNLPDGWLISTIDGINYPGIVWCISRQFQTKFFSCILIGSRAKNKSAGGILPNQSGFFGGVFGSEFSSYIKLYILERRTNSECCLIIIIRKCCGENHSLTRRNPVLSRHFNFFGSPICLFPYKGTGIKCGCWSAVCTLLICTKQFHE